MLYRSGENLFSGLKSFIDNSTNITLFSAYLKLEEFEKINTENKINQIIVRWEIQDLCLGVSDIELYEYCIHNNIALYRNTRIHLKAFWNNASSVYFGSANVTGRGIGENENYNFELNGLNEKLTFEDRIYLNKIILESEYVDQELFNKITNLVNNVDIPVTKYPLLPTPPPTDDFFLINQLPMTSSPELLYKIYKGEKQDVLEMDCAAHDLELYRITKDLSEIDFFNHLQHIFNLHPFINAFKEAVKSNTNERNPDRNGSMQFGAVKKWFSDNTTTVPTPRSFELNSYVKILYTWICYFDKSYSWDIPGERSEVIYNNKRK